MTTVTSSINTYYDITSIWKDIGNWNYLKPSTVYLISLSLWTNNIPQMTYRKIENVFLIDWSTFFCCFHMENKIQQITCNVKSYESRSTFRRLTRGPFHFISQWKSKSTSIFIFMLGDKIADFRCYVQPFVSTQDYLPRDPCLFHWVL